MKSTVYSTCSFNVILQNSSLTLVFLACQSKRQSETCQYEEHGLQYMLIQCDSPEQFFNPSLLACQSRGRVKHANTKSTVCSTCSFNVILQNSSLTLVFLACQSKRQSETCQYEEHGLQYMLIQCDSPEQFFNPSLLACQSKRQSETCQYEEHGLQYMLIQCDSPEQFFNPSLLACQSKRQRGTCQLIWRAWYTVHAHSLWFSRTVL